MRITVCDNVDPVFDRIMKEKGYDVVRSKNLEDMINSDIIVVRSATRIGPEILKKFSGKIIARAGSGIDNIDWKYAITRDIMVLTAPESIATSVAELTVLLMLALYRRMKELILITESGRDVDRNEYRGYLLQGKNVGVIGAGKVGSRVIELLRSFGANVIVYDPVMEWSVPLNEVYERSDIISYHVPLTSRTRGMINRESIIKMRRMPFLINTSRAGIMNVNDVIWGLDNGRIRGIGMDFVIPELRGRPNVVMLPHIGATTVESQQEVARELAHNILQVMRGKFVESARTWPRWYLPVVLRWSKRVKLARVPRGTEIECIPSWLLQEAISLTLQGEYESIYAALKEIQLLVSVRKERKEKDSL